MYTQREVGSLLMRAHHLMNNTNQASAATNLSARGGKYSTQAPRGGVTMSGWRAAEPRDAKQKAQNGASEGAKFEILRFFFYACQVAGAKHDETADENVAAIRRPLPLHGDVVQGENATVTSTVNSPPPLLIEGEPPKKHARIDGNGDARKPTAVVAVVKLTEVTVEGGGDDDDDNAKGAKSPPRVIAAIADTTSDRPPAPPQQQQLQRQRAMSPASDGSSSNDESPTARALNAAIAAKRPLITGATAAGTPIVRVMPLLSNAVADMDEADDDEDEDDEVQSDDLNEEADDATSATCVDEIFGPRAEALFHDNVGLHTQKPRAHF